MTSKNLSNLLSILIRLSLVFSAMTVVFPSQITAQIQPRTQTPDKSGGNTGPSGTRDDGFDMCPAFQHYHPTESEAKSGGITDADIGRYLFSSDYFHFDGLCHDDHTDEPVKEQPRTAWWKT